MPHSTMSIDWRNEVGFMFGSAHEVYISPPDWSQPDEFPKYFKGHLLDVKTLTIRDNNVEWKNYAEAQQARALAERRESENGRLDPVRDAFHFWRLLAIIEGIVALGIGWMLYRKRALKGRSTRLIT